MNSLTYDKSGRTIYFVLFWVIFVATFYISGLEGATPDVLDASWQVAIEYAFVNGLHFGRDIIFTYGPLGFLVSDVSQAHLIIFRAAFAFIWTAIVAYSAISAARLMPVAVRWFFITWILVFSAYSGIEYYLYSVLAYGVLLVLFTVRRSSLIIISVLICFAFLALIKFTMLLAVVAVVVICTLVKVVERQWREAVLLPVGLLVFFVSAWCAVGQELSLLVPWLEGGIEMASGHTAAMSNGENAPVLYFVITAMVLFVGTAGLALRATIRDSARFGMFICIILFAFLTWKQGVIRPDSVHVPCLFIPFPLLLCFMYVAPLQAFENDSRARIAVLGLAMVSIVCLSGMVFQNKDFIRETIIYWPTTIKAKLQCIGNLLTGRADKVYIAQKNPSQNWAPDLPRVRAIVGTERIDVMNCRQWVAIANGLNYSPRPIIQGYPTYTPFLINLNKQFLSNEAAPAFVLLAMETIDDRFPTLDDSGALASLLHHYRPVISEQSYLLLQRQHEVPLQLEQVFRRTLRFGEKLNVTSWAGETLFMSVEIKPSLTLKLRRLLYREPRINIRVQSGGEDFTFRFIPAMASVPFIVSPLLGSNNDVLTLFNKLGSESVSEVSFGEASTVWGRFDEPFSVTLYRAVY